MNFHPNMNFAEIAGRYALLMVVGIIGGVLHNIFIMTLAIPIFMTAITGWSPIYKMLGINHAMDKEGEKQIQGK